MIAEPLAGSRIDHLFVVTLSYFEDHIVIEARSPDLLTKRIGADKFDHFIALALRIVDQIKSEMSHISSIIFGYEVDGSQHPS